MSTSRLVSIGGVARSRLFELFQERQLTLKSAKVKAWVYISRYIIGYDNKFPM